MSTANDFFILKNRYEQNESVLESKIVELLNLDNIFFENIIYDDYDYSFEVEGIEDYNYRCTKEEIKEIFDLGFEKFWIVFDDGSELEYNKSHPNVCFYKDSGKILIRKEFLDDSEMCNCTINWAEGGNCFVCGKIRRININEGTFSSL